MGVEVRLTLLIFTINNSQARTQRKKTKSPFHPKYKYISNKVLIVNTFAKFLIYL